MATCCSFEGRAPTQRGVVRSHEAESQSTGEVTGWSRCWNGFVVCPSELSHTDSASSVPCCVVETSPTPFASIVAHMPVWPPNRQVWPPPSIVRTSRGVGAKGVRTGKRDSQSLQGSLEAESQPTSWSVIWTLLNQGPQTDAGLRWLWMASPCLGDAS